MPEISRFLGIVIYMYFNEHNEARRGMYLCSGMLIDQFIPAQAFDVITVKLFRHFHDNRLDGYTLQSIC